MANDLANNGQTLVRPLPPIQMLFSETSLREAGYLGSDRSRKIIITRLNGSVRQIGVKSTEELVERLHTDPTCLYFTHRFGKICREAVERVLRLYGVFI